MRAGWSETDGRLRLVLGGIAVAALAIGLGYLFEVPAATATWPFEVTRITYLFLAAVTIAFALPVAWVAWTGDIAALAGIGLTVALAYGLFSLLLLMLIGGNSGLAINLVLGAGVAAIGAVGFVVGLRRSPLDTRVTPQWVRTVFFVLGGILIVTGGLMMLRVPNILPWNVDLETQQLVGALFVGDAAYFLYAAKRPAWPNAAGAWLAFLAYDLILVIPLLNHFAVVRDEHRLGLVLYVAVVVTTLVLAAYSLLIDRRTRIVGSRSAAPAGSRP